MQLHAEPESLLRSHLSLSPYDPVSPATPSPATDITPSPTTPGETERAVGGILNLVCEFDVNQGIGSAHFCDRLFSISSISDFSSRQPPGVPIRCTAVETSGVSETVARVCSS